MRRPTRNLLYVVIGVVCVAFLVQGVGLHLPRIVKALTAVSGGAASSSSSRAAVPGGFFGRHGVLRVSGGLRRSDGETVHRDELE